MATTLGSQTSFIHRGAEISIVGLPEIQQWLGIGEQQLDQLARQPTFPEPWQKLHQGDVWLAERIHDWFAENHPHLMRMTDR